MFSEKYWNEFKIYYFVISILLGILFSFLILFYVFFSTLSSQKKYSFKKPINKLEAISQSLKN